MLKRIQALLQWCFVKVEGLFNLAFGEKLNPLYYIGSISYYLMWLIVASGLYLYAFFETSVTGASGSVEALTHAQPWAGGVLRSVHRYASDGVVLTMLLHMARHWAFDHYRGFRWFSWVSGLVLLWLLGRTGAWTPAVSLRCPRLPEKRRRGRNRAGIQGRTNRGFVPEARQGRRIAAPPGAKLEAIGS